MPPPVTGPPPCERGRLFPAAAPGTGSRAFCARTSLDVHRMWSLAKGEYADLHRVRRRWGVSQYDGAVLGRTWLLERLRVRPSNGERHEHRIDHPSSRFLRRGRRGRGGGRCRRFRSCPVTALGSLDRADRAHSGPQGCPPRGGLAPHHLRRPSDGCRVTSSSGSAGHDHASHGIGRRQGA